MVRNMMVCARRAAGEGGRRARAPSRTTDHLIQQMIVLGLGLRGVSGDETPENGFVLGVADAGKIQEQAEANRHILDGR